MLYLILFRPMADKKIEMEYSEIKDFLSLFFPCMIHVVTESIWMQSALILIQILVSKYLYLEPATLAL